MPSEGHREHKTKIAVRHLFAVPLYLPLLVSALLILLTRIPESIKLFWGFLLVPEIAICLFCSMAQVNQFLYYYPSALNLSLIHYHVSHRNTMFSIKFTTYSLLALK